MTINDEAPDEHYSPEELADEAAYFGAMYEAEKAAEECERDIEPWKRKGYAEMIYEAADDRRKAAREEAYEKADRQRTPRHT